MYSPAADHHAPLIRWPEGLRAMRHRNFRLFFFGQLISVSGTLMQSTAQEWLVYRLTGSQLSLGMLAFLANLPVLLLSLFMGVIVDRLPRRKILVFTQSWFTFLAAVLAVITFLGVVQYWHLLLLSILMGIGTALDMPARQAFYSDMVEREDLLSAIALTSSVFNGARIIGPALSGLIVAALGEAPAFAINALSYLTVIGGLLLMRLTPRRPPNPAIKGLTSFRQGLSYLRHDRRVLGLVSMTGLLSTFSFPFVVLLPVYARDILKIGAQGFGGLTAARGLGALLGALSVAFLGSRQHKGRVLVAGRILTILGTAGMALSRTALQACLALVLCGFALMIQLTSTNTLIQLVVPEELRGRVISAYSWALAGFWPLGSLLMGSLGERFGAQTTVLAAAAASAALVVLGWLAFPESNSMR